MGSGRVRELFVPRRVFFVNIHAYIIFFFFTFCSLHFVVRAVFFIAKLVSAGGDFNFFPCAVDVPLLLQINVKIEEIKELRNDHRARLDQW